MPTERHGSRARSVSCLEAHGATVRRVDQGRRGLFESASTAPYDGRDAAWQSGARHARPFRMRGACWPDRQADSAMAHRYVRNHRRAETSLLFPHTAHAPCDVNKPRWTTEVGAFIHGINVATAQCNGSFPLINSHVVTCWALTSCHCLVIVIKPMIIGNVCLPV